MWLGEERADIEELVGLLRPYPADLMRAYPVGKRVGSVRNQRSGATRSAGHGGIAPMFGVEHEGSALDTIAHMIQVALTPVFLLTGIATLLNVFSTRLARVADRVEAVSKALDGADADERRILSAQLAHLHRQSIALNVAVILAGIGGAATCAAVLTLFVGALRDMTVASVLFGLFGLAVVCALGAIAAYTVEMMIAGTGIRKEVAQSRREAAVDEAVEAEAHPVGAETGGGGEGGAGS